MQLEAYELVILRRPEGATPYDEETLERIQSEHLAFHARLRADGVVVANGPLLDQPDESIRGLTLYRTGSLQRARALAEQDPSVRAGRLVVDVMTWLCQPGALHLPGQPVEPA
jgi:uncharacterized protein YciI